MINLIKKHIFMSIFSGSTILVILGVFLVFIVIMGLSASNEDDGSDCDDSSTSQSIVLPSDADQEKTAKAIYDYLTTNDGFTSAGAAGAIANAQRESSFSLTSINTSGGVGGLFQWSFGGSPNGNRMVGGGFMNPDDQSTWTFDNEMKLMSWEFKNESHGQATLTKVAPQTDPEQAALDWSQYYEGVLLNDPQTKPDEIKNSATAWYVKLGGSDPITESTVNTATSPAPDGSDEDSSSDGCYVDGDSADGGGDVVTLAKELASNTPPYSYVLGGNPENLKTSGTDCSGFTSYVWKHAANVVLPRTAQQQADAYGKLDRDDLQPGDLVFYHNGFGSEYIDHVALYIGDGKIAQEADEKTGCIISSIDGGGHFEFGGRVKKDSGDNA
ncbi:peptidoglycan endopeptidase [Periweissella cryptocerci]|uniref:Peptidoglycan endopeptidase n=1 Tax=Periweissella cryptocerci TaxID=2506420 RepID=A0A4P6YX27_9LACO|nr:phage tail tip lysozyme [Periweissella cryptocerci]QBO37410.1 peptidoglycan endopeptidase [Periweissella cryptocerci]